MFGACPEADDRDRGAHIQTRRAIRRTLRGRTAGSRPGRPRGVSGGAPRGTGGRKPRSAQGAASDLGRGDPREGSLVDPTSLSRADISTTVWIGAPGRNRTCDTRFRKPVLFSTELRGPRAGPVEEVAQDHPPGYRASSQLESRRSRGRNGARRAAQHPGDRDLPTEPGGLRSLTLAWTGLVTPPDSGAGCGTALSPSPSIRRRSTRTPRDSPPGGRATAGSG
jgi:hypothetical protein